MKNTVFLIIFFLFNSYVFAQSQSTSHLCNYLQIDSFLYDYQNIVADNNNNSGETQQTFTGRPSLNFCFQSQNFIFRPFIALNPYNSSTNGDFSIGKIFQDNIEIGLYLSLNRSQKKLGNGDTKSETIESNLLFGPYIKIFHTSIVKNDLEFTLRISYEYLDQRMTINNSSTLMTEQKGVNIFIEELYAKELTSHLFIVPYISFNYSYTYDSVGISSGRNTFDLKISPLSFRWIL
ncbi:hypothetical protein [Fluviispira multicolorata]|uniref:Outer membrane protein beta-barrel domain-containing protein n=1 Tax=Fluviispira multicolorata TaxID=2654512 RepID=A0A833JH99_9BACT|nr:hypothetical protein [Fluviispira multicolorata]KAB8033357.1 hypothetical protein GCL57_01260 [Fluviispira multicolorata]